MSQKLIMYGTSWCGYTKKAVAEFEAKKDLLEANNIEMEYVDCEGPGNKELCSSKGIGGFPTMDIFGKMVAGYQPVEQIVSSMSACAAP